MASPTVHIKKRYLLAPGPTPTPEQVISVFAQPVMHHRTSEFEEVMADVKKRMQWVFQTKQDVIMLAATGSGAMDAAISNIFRTGDKVITCNAGKFGERWTKIAKAYGLNPIEIKIKNGATLKMPELENTIKAHKDAKAILFQASETSTGVCLPTKEICALAQKSNMITLCDAITACGVFDLPMDKWGIDVMISGSQKAFMIPPGLAFIAMSDKAWQVAESNNIPHFYFNLKKEKDALSENTTAWTPAISLIMGLQESLKMMQAEGLENAFKRHHVLAEATRAGVKALGLKLFAEEMPSDAVTSVTVPDGVDGNKIPKIMRVKYGVTIAGGQDELKGKIFRLSHFGYVGPFDVTTGLACLELVLDELGHKVEFGKSVGAALAVMKGQLYN